jgi:hypothetical protein
MGFNEKYSNFNVWIEEKMWKRLGVLNCEEKVLRKIWVVNCDFCYINLNLCLEHNFGGNVLTDSIVESLELEEDERLKCIEERWKLNFFFFNYLKT